jgi:hypothetical protein
VDPDYVRFVIFVLYGLTVGHVAWIVKIHAKYARRLLPRHISVVGVAFLMALTEVVWQNARRVGEDYSHYVTINLIIMSFSLFAMRDMRRFLHSKGVPPPRRKTDL